MCVYVCVRGGAHSKALMFYCSHPTSEFSIEPKLCLFYQQATEVVSHFVFLAPLLNALQNRRTRQKCFWVLYVCESPLGMPRSEGARRMMLLHCWRLLVPADYHGRKFTRSFLVSLPSSQSVTSFIFVAAIIYTSLQTCGMLVASLYIASSLHISSSRVWKASPPSIVRSCTRTGRPRASYSQFDSLDLVIDFMVKWVEVADERFFDEGTGRWLVAWLSLLQASVKDGPLLIKLVALFWVLLHSELLAHLWLHLHGLLESIWVDFLQDCL